MSRPFIKSRLQIGNKLLGDLFYDKDAEGRSYIKLSFNNKIAGLFKWSNVPTLKPALLKSDQPTRLEVSYKFPDNLFALKMLTNGKWNREFHKMPLPHTSCLFIVRIKDPNLLTESTDDGRALVLDPLEGSAVSIIFAFPGSDGIPRVPLEYPGLRMASIDLPESPLNKLWIGIANDPSNNFKEGFVLSFPFQLELDIN
jgi:hypothetical protein